jgi:hypothetical protein
MAAPGSFGPLHGEKDAACGFLLPSTAKTNLAYILHLRGFYPAGVRDSVPCVILGQDGDG